MKYEVTTAEKSTVKITFTFTAEEWAEANNKAYVQTRGRYAVNGFRKGKVPKHVLELYYGKGLFYEDALNLLYQEHYPATLDKEQKKFTAVGEPTLSVDDISEEKVVLSAVVPVKPDVEIEKYKGIKIKKFEYTVTDADVEAQIELMRDRVAEKVDVTDRAAKMGDTVNIDFVGKVNGKEFEGGTAKGYDLTLGSGQFIPGFEEGVVGVKLGESKDVAVKFPEDYQAEELKGKDAVFTVTLHKITGKKLPELNDEFAKKMGSETVEKYRAAVKERLERNAKARALNETEDSILTEIAKGAKAEIPEVLISRQEDSIMQRMQYNLLQEGISMEDYLKYLNTTREEYKKNFEEEARRTVLHQLIIEKIIKLEKIKAEQKEIDAKIAEQAASVGKSAEEYKKTMDPRQFEYIENDIIITKLFDFLMKNNEMVTEGGASKKSAAKPAAKKAEPKEETVKAEKPAAKKAEPKEETVKAEKPAAKKAEAKPTAEKKPTKKSASKKPDPIIKPVVKPKASAGKAAKPAEKKTKKEN